LGKRHRCQLFLDSRSAPAAFDDLDLFIVLAPDDQLADIDNTRVAGWAFSLVAFS
jgi:hypothetical protein